MVESPGRTDLARFALQTIPVWSRHLRLFLEPGRFWLRMEDFDFLDDSATLAYLTRNGYGLCRLGNSELTFVAGRDVRHQRQDARLRKILIEILRDYNELGPHRMGMLLSLPLDMTIGEDYFNRAGLSMKAGSYRKDIWQKSPLWVIRRLVRKGSTYGSASCFRFGDCVPSEGLQTHISGFLQLMRSKPTLYVGPLVDHDTVKRFLPNAKLLEIPPRNAFDFFDEIVKEIQWTIQGGPDRHVLITAGMTGTALSYTLAKMGITALDVGQSFRQLARLLEENPRIEIAI